MSLLSVIVPCYNEEESVALFYRELTKNDPFFKEKEIELELLYIDDGSKDGTGSEKADRAGSARAYYFLLQEFRKRSRHVRRTGKVSGRLCGHDGCGSAGSAFPVAGNVRIYLAGI